MPGCCRGVTRTELPEFLLVRQLFSSLGFHDLLVLESQLSVLIELKLLLLELQKAVSLFHFFLASQLCGGNALPGLLQGVGVDPRREAGSAGQLWKCGSGLGPGR